MGKLKCGNYSHQNFNFPNFAHPTFTVNMDTSPSLAVAVDKLLKDVVKGPLIDNKGEFSTAKIAKPL